MKTATKLMILLIIVLISIPLLSFVFFLKESGPSVRPSSIWEISSSMHESELVKLPENPDTDTNAKKSNSGKR